MTSPHWRDVRQHWPLYTFLPFLVAMLGADSRVVLERGIDGQLIANLLVPLYLLAMIWRADPALRRLMVLVVPLSLGGEVLCSLILGLYHYKGGMIPPYVPFGHAIVFSTGFMFDRATGLTQASWGLRRVLVAGYAVALGGVVVFLHDTLSLVLGALFFLLLRRKGWQSLYLVMGLVVLTVELVGTRFGCWAWEPQALGILRAANPPVGAVVFYIFGDMLALRVHRLLPALDLRLLRSVTAYLPRPRRGR